MREEGFYDRNHKRHEEKNAATGDEIFWRVARKG
jgi:hypothetical protein